MTHTDATLAALLRAVLLDPADDAARLVLADRLEETGDGERADFVRVQVKLASDFTSDELSDPDADPVPGGRLAQRYARDTYRRWRDLKGRERELLLRSADQHSVQNWIRWGEPCQAAYCLNLYRHQPLAGNTAVTFRRGFVESVECPLAAWERHGPAVCARQPVTAVRLTDREPEAWPQGPAAWYCAFAYRQVPDYLPRALFAALPEPTAAKDQLVGVKVYDSPQAAFDALSVGAVNYARSAAGLPPLAADAPAKCPRCDGLGWYTPMGPDTFNRRCEECGGKGALPADA